jgi:membrane associated rhomboid family serine protease
MMNVTPFVKQLLIINIVFFIGSQLVPLADQYFALYYFENTSFRFWQPLTRMFMHANFMHIFFNMFALYSFGSALEHFWGGNKFLFFYISCGLGAAFLHTLVNYFQIHTLLDSVSSLNLSPSDLKFLLNADLSSIFDESNKIVPSTITSILEKAQVNREQFITLIEANAIAKSTAVGASGAIYGLLVAFAFMFPDAKLGLMFIPIPIKAMYFVPLYMLLYDGFFGIFGSTYLGVSTGIGHFAHIGGAITGFIMMWFWKKNQFNKNRWN